MVQSISPQARVDRNRCMQIAGILSLDMAVHAGVGATTASIVALNPAIGSAFGALYFAGSHSVNALERWLEIKVGREFGSQSTLAKTLKFFLAFWSGIILASAGSTFIGTPIIFSTGMTLTAAMLATTATIGAFVLSYPFAKNAIMGPSVFTQRA